MICATVQTDLHSIGVDSNSSGAVELSSWHLREVDRADVVILVHELDNEDSNTVERSLKCWLSAVQQQRQSSKSIRHLPIVLAASKRDKHNGEAIQLKQAILRTSEYIRMQVCETTAEPP